ncbi:hypothetical protein DR999_PMT08386 [Platysternon megacephalum]|uniref:Uncharacterized protein n=1 Tax=Platysternon megacephalum TaxID=55544 RepID=A0A4D9ES46_9SAUR|nr:hypothetical protein DR999_PMT08386 [Platysternon megacephalum]
MHGEVRSAPVRLARLQRSLRRPVQGGEHQGAPRRQTFPAQVDGARAGGHRESRCHETGRAGDTQILSPSAGGKETRKGPHRAGPCGSASVGSFPCSPAEISLHQLRLCPYSGTETDLQ